MVSVLTFYGARMQVGKNDFDIKAKPFKLIALLSANTCYQDMLAVIKFPNILKVAVWLIKLGH